MSDVVVVGVGARIATGTNALTSAMTLRAGKSFVRESRFVDRAGEAVALAAVDAIADTTVGRDRYVELAAAPLAEAVAPWALHYAAQGHTPPPLGLLLAQPAEVDPSDPRGAKLLAALAAQAKVAVDPSRSRVFAEGRAGGATAFAEALLRLGRGDDDAILVGGVDSYVDPERLDELDRERRLHGPATENGFIPGEGAAFLLLVARRRAGAHVSYARVLSAATEKEPRPWGSPEPCHALGMGLALERVLGSVAGRRIGWALSDVVGERHRVEEWLHAMGRVQSAFAETLHHEQPLVLAGDLGAAAAPVLAVLACVRWNTGSAPAELALVAVHSDTEERGAIVLAAGAA